MGFLGPSMSKDEVRTEVMFFAAGNLTLKSLCQKVTNLQKLDRILMKVGTDRCP